MFVESGLGVRVKFDLSNTIYVTVTTEHLAATRGLCGIYNNNADGRPNFLLLLLSSVVVSLADFFFVFAKDDFTTMGGRVSQYAASFGNSWKVPDQKNEVITNCV